MSVPIEQFLVRLKIHSTQIPADELVEYHIRVGVAAIKGLWFRTAGVVDTGRLRENWQTTINLIPTEESRTPDPVSAALPVIERLKPFDTLYFSNNVPYAGIWDQGRMSPANSRRVVNGFHVNAPGGFTRPTRIELQNTFG